MHQTTDAVHPKGGLLTGTFERNECWFAAAGQQPAQPTPSVRQTAFYIGMQLEELAEKIAAVIPPGASDSPLLALVALMEMEGTNFKDKASNYNGYVAAALADPAKAQAMLDGDVDLLWVSVGGARAQGADIAGAYGAVADANWAKRWDDGTFHLDQQTGKVLKPPGWKAPDLTQYTHPTLKGAAA